MRRLRISHRTAYRFSKTVTLGPHRLLLRPREGHEVHIESSKLEITPPAQVRWHRDVDDNSVATATFGTPTDELEITSEVICQHYDSAPLDFIVDPTAVMYPFTYSDDEAAVLVPYRICSEPLDGQELINWVAGFWQSGQSIQTYALLDNICSFISQGMTYRKRETPGVQTAVRTLAMGEGSCRDFANLFIEATRLLGIASRFVSGYLYNPPSDTDYGATHAWAEVFLPGAGWKGFDPTLGKVAGNDHISVAVSRRPDNIPPVAGSYYGDAQSELSVWVEVNDV